MFGRRNCYNRNKVLAGICIGAGIGIFLILYLPLIVWLYIIAAALVIAGIKILFDN